DVLRQSGARLVEVGTTNRTYVEDYDNACTHETAAFLRVHTSNFRVIGFTPNVELEELVALARRRGVQVLDDLGSGCLLDTARYGLMKEPQVQESVQAGADLAFFSGDKLLGGPQAGIVVGKKAQVDWLKRHPLARAVRIDKASLAGLAATLVHYLRNEAEDKVPVWRMIATQTSELEARAHAWQARLGGATAVADGRSMIGGGSLPEESLPTKLLAIPQEALGQRLTLEDLAAQLRAARPAVVARIERGRLLFDPRTVLPGEEDALLQAIEDRLPRP
ncbi:MAG TPA: L-seryl-tRNA(Sec) selenium transferase, partial [Dehalococcoidia bacterium]|nr:L-seryl-tRNA(Sec) selenium transferase [Dehalococcoidia bacterium]